MIDFTVSTDIARSPAEVFAYATDPSKLHTWQQTTVSSVPETDGPMGVGTRLREVHRGPGSRESESLVEVSRYDVGKAFGARIVEGPLKIDADLEFAATGTGTTVSFRAFGQPTGFLRVMQPLLRRVLTRQFSSDLDLLKKTMESGG